MIMDTLTQFCDADSVANAAGTDLIGDVVDLETIRDIGKGHPPLYLVIQCQTSIITGGAAGTIKFALASDDAAAIATDGSATIHFETDTFVTDGDDANELDAGAIIAIVPLPWGSLRSYERYLGILATVGTTTVTAGAIDAFLTLNPQGWVALADEGSR